LHDSVLIGAVAGDVRPPDDALAATVVAYVPMSTSISWLRVANRGPSSRIPGGPVPGPYPLRHRGPVSSHVPQQVYVVARAQGLLFLNGPVAVVRGLGVQVIRAAASEIILDDRIEYGLPINAG
jgi:hypothetical protein